MPLVVSTIGEGRMRPISHMMDYWTALVDRRSMRRNCWYLSISMKRWEESNVCCLLMAWIETSVSIINGDVIPTKFIGLPLLPVGSRFDYPD